VKIYSFRSLICLLTATFLSTYVAYPQDSVIPPYAWTESGLPYIQNFSPADYKGGTQNFSIVQDERGLIYVGNNWGVLIYDGVTWRLVKLPNQGAVRSLCRVKDRIYTGGVGELGYLEADVSGRLQYTSLLNTIPEEFRDFKDVYDIVHFENEIFFRTRYTLFRLSENGFSVWQSDQELQPAFAVNGTLFVGERTSGLCRFIDDSLRIIPGSELFIDNHVTAMLPYDDATVLIGTFNKGLYLYDGSEIRPLRTSADEILYNMQVRHGIYLTHGLYAFGTAHGVVVVDRDGNLCQVVNKSAGLLDELTISLFADRQNGLWLALNNGISRIEILSPLSRFHDTSGIESFVQSILRHNGRIYTTTDRGVFYLDRAVHSFNVFKPIEGIATLSWSLLSVGERLLAGTQDAIFEITGTRAEKINNLSAIVLHRSKRDSTVVFAGLLEGLAAMRMVDNSWQTLGKVPWIHKRIISISEDDTGILWLGTQAEGILRVDPSRLEFQAGVNGYTPDQDMIFNGEGIMRLGKQHGLPSGPTTPSLVGTKLVFKTLKGLLRFDDTRQMFVPDSTFGAVFADTSCWINDIRRDNDGSVWIVGGNDRKNYTGKAVPQPDGSYLWQETPFLRMKDLGRIYFSYPEANGVVWFGGAEGIARYTPHIPGMPDMSYPTIIRRVNNLSTDSVIYHGASFAGKIYPEFDHTNNSLRFEFAAMSFDDPAANRYQVKLDGFDADWSGWSGETRKDYTGLSAGRYTFRVRAKNIYEQLADEDTFTFTVMYPWYQSWWAILMYLFLGGGILVGIVKLRVRRLEKRTSELESIIAERTKVIRDQTEKLKELDKMKSRFYANISHEFRTPLTLILGPLEELISKAKNQSDVNEFNMMYRNARRLLRLIIELLDLSRLESGKLKLQAGKGDFIAFLRGIVMSFASLAEHKGIILDFESDRESVSLQDDPGIYFDPDKIEKIFTNLLSNAFKFTSRGGEVHCSVRVSKCGPRDETGGADTARFIPECRCVEVVVKDTGIGIPADRIPYIFDRFYQINGTGTRDHEGAGIGLALTKELTVLHRGSINVESRERYGTTFIVRLPVGKTHLSPEEIVVYDAQNIPFSEPYLEIESDVDWAKIPDDEMRSHVGEQPRDIVLIIDDHPDVRYYLRKHLEKEYHIVETHDGENGFTMAVDIIPDLVISDVKMPGMNGFQLCAALKTNEKTSHIPVILLTAKADEQDEISGLETGADDYLTKPFSAKHLQARVRNLIEQRQVLRQRFVREGIMQPREVAVTSKDEEFIHKLMSIIEENLSDENFGINELSEQIYIGIRQLHRKIRGVTGKSPAELIRTVRLHRARYLLEQKAGNVTEIALQVGFNNLSHFAKVFRQEFGKSPSEILQNRNVSDFR
jgi:signal transduction histidine kinase/DNA-binding response OmpR family regulator